MARTLFTPSEHQDLYPPGVAANVLNSHVLASRLVGVNSGMGHSLCLNKPLMVVAKPFGVLFAVHTVTHQYIHGIVHQYLSYTGMC